jgi:Domain of unknown function (DUF4440)
MDPELRSPEDVLRDLERRRTEALVVGDMTVSRRQHADDYELISGGGDRLSKDEYLGGIESGELRYLVFEPASELRVRLYDDVAIVRYLARIDIRFPGGRDAGLFWHTDVYERRDGAWQVVWSQATPDPDTRTQGQRSAQDV